MFGQRHFPWSRLALVGLAVVWLVPGPARAGVVLAVSMNNGYGVFACLDHQCTYAPATENPARAINGSVESTLAQGGSFIRFAFTLQDTSGQPQYASTAYSPTFANVLQIAILGTAGEPVGMPVSLRLKSGTDVDPDIPKGEITNLLNGTEYDPYTDEIINGFKLGDTFWYWASVGVPGNAPISFQVDLSVQELGNAAVPEPGTLALLITAGLALGVLSLPRANL